MIAYANVALVLIKGETCVISVSRIALAGDFVLYVEITVALLDISVLISERYPGVAVAELVGGANRALVPEIVEKRSSRIHIRDYELVILAVEIAVFDHFYNPFGKCFFSNFKPNASFCQ
jgi:hypothetical protein